MDDIACVLHSADQLLVLVLDHEELITLSRLRSSQAARHGQQVATALRPSTHRKAELLEDLTDGAAASGRYRSPAMTYPPAGQDRAGLT